MDQDSSLSLDQQSMRQACELCRRKKIKCPGQKPLCSTCERSSQPCTYKPREPCRTEVRRTGVVKPTSKRDSDVRLNRLENRLSDVFDILRSLTASPNSPQSHRILSTYSLEAATSCESFHTVLSSPTRPLPNNAAAKVDRLIACYRQTIHFQPLPLFDLEVLHSNIIEGPPYLFWIFLATTSEFLTDDDDLEAEAATGFAGAQDEVGKLAAQGVGHLPIRQAMCLMVLYDIRTHQHQRAWMTTGTASTLQALQQTTNMNELDCRCFWSIFILERMFFPRMSQSLRFEKNIRYPTSPAPPRDSQGEFGQEIHGNLVEDLGIHAYSIGYVAMWSKVTSWLHSIHFEKREQPWLPGSTYANLTAELLDCEARLPSRHLIRNVVFNQLSPTQTLEQQEYWRPWLTMQILSHASLAIVNHPFLHLVALRPDKSLHPRLFLQQTVDQALYHSRWVSRFIGISDGLFSEPFDPALADVVASTATVSFLFQYANDDTISSNAKADWQRFNTFLSRVSEVWPYIGEKFQALDKFTVSVRTKPSSSTLVFSPTMFWNVLDSDSTLPTQAPPTSTASSCASINVTTQFVQPLADDEDEHSTAPRQDAMSGIAGFDESRALDELCMDDLLSRFAPSDFDWPQE
ncbi:hypothetical protein K461DRAFT_310957 [Myriangium duriaei CBS 260.36]|uniref:Zn(2)-C6 fungal-type domain-containing protein n=1 Tax=Myriangium duriaei CBS 260.36 TaxID=1168546 RepID=A0A9P4J7K4_9PEZI|nr:hypothetical protein K461DRAFT_310957 [Myriangium duriaei CBS 260.36]